VFIRLGAADGGAPDIDDYADRYSVTSAQTWLVKRHGSDVRLLGLAVTYTFCVDGEAGLTGRQLVRMPVLGRAPGRPSSARWEPSRGFLVKSAAAP
jgi:hypothetical protein